MGRLEQIRVAGWTLANMQPTQLRGVVTRTVRNQFLPMLPLSFEDRYDVPESASVSITTGPVWENTSILTSALSEETRSLFRDRARATARGQVIFLNRTLKVGSDEGGVAWNHDTLDDLPRLWRLKLHGFEPFDWLVTGFEPDATPASVESVFKAWVADWLQENPPGEGRYLRGGWAPYAVSRRIQNWSRYAAWRTKADDPPSRRLRAGLYKNVQFLDAHVEHDVGGNHLVENGTALVMGGTLLDDGEDFLQRGIGLLSSVTSEQFLADGGHFERSPMYHIQVLMGYLTAVDLCERVGVEYPDVLRTTVHRGLDFLDTIAPPDDRIPLLNDAVFGETVSLTACQRYARATAIDSGRRSDGCTSGQQLSASGYYWLGDGDSRALVDAGPVGPPHLPGHSHNDFLSTLLWVEGKRVIADTGAYSYERGPRRQYARSVKSHSTVQVDNLEPIELGGRFLLGRRTEPSVEYRTGPVDALHGWYTSPQGYTHDRWVYGTTDWWLVWDAVSNSGSYDVRSRVVFHPDVAIQPVVDGTTVDVTDRHGRRLLEVVPLRIESFTCTTGRYFPRFGMEQSRDVLELSPKEIDGFGHIFVREQSSRDPPRVRMRDGTPSEIEYNDSIVTLPQI